MRRFLVLVLLLCASLVSRAQWGVSANASFSCSNYTYAESGLEAFNNSLPRGWALDFAPRVVYAFGQNLCVGADLGFGYSNQRYTDGFYSPLTEVWERSEILCQEFYSAAVGLFARYKVHDWGRLQLHAELSASYRGGLGTNTTTQYAKDAFGEMKEVVSECSVMQHRLQLQLVPVVRYLLGASEHVSHCSLDLYLNFVSVAFTHTDTRVVDGEFGIDSKVSSQTVADNLGLGLRLLDASPVSFGFTYFF